MYIRRGRRLQGEQLELIRIEIDGKMRRGECCELVSGWAELRGEEGLARERIGKTERRVEVGQSYQEEG